VAAITTVSGNVPVERATRNVFTILSLLSPDQRPPVAMGSSKPLKKEPLFAAAVHGDEGLGGLYDCQDDYGIPRYPTPSVTPSIRDGPDEILFQVASGPGGLTVIALGPLTNIAEAINRDRGTMERLKRVIVMGGAIGVAGNVTAVSEFNMYADPHAARVVFRAGLPLTVVGLNVTQKVRLTRDMVNKQIAPRQTAISRFVCDCTSDLFVFFEEREGEASFSLHDPLAVGVAIDPSLVSCEPMHVDIETGGVITDGMTVADRRPIRPLFKDPPNAEVCLDVDAPRFLRLFLERLGPR
jgi:purine nucleosidase/pyrimidine-specific ribonucleoside hydrolase